MSTLWDTIKKGIKDGAKIAKDGAHIAAEKAEILSKKSKVMIEISNIKRKIEKNFTELGGKVYHLIQEEKVENVAEKDEIKKLLDTISAFEGEMKKKEKELEQIGIAYQPEEVEKSEEIAAQDEPKDDI
ncbi:hypothetical protein AMJ80_07880 [bacterium SM23_31]|nr:MAG: hypothetical protein AMJ80_07880 [bacterium SM23_31]